jgi:2-dehydropantoate 2-reductase
MIDKSEVVRKINNQGIRIITDRENEFKPIAQTELTKIPAQTLILLTTKAHQTKTALRKIKNLLRSDTVILILQNGLGNEAMVRKIIGDRGEVIRGIVNSGAWEQKPGCFALILRETVLEPTETAKTIAALFNRSGIPTRISLNFNTELWQKLILNCVANPLTAILRVRNYQIGVPILSNLRRQIVEECIKVAKAEGIMLNANLPEALAKAIQGYTNFSSMYQDIIRHRKTEIDFLNGKIVELAKRHNISVPINEALTAMIKFLEGK